MCYNFHKINAIRNNTWQKRETIQSYNCGILTVSQNNKNSIILSKIHFVKNQKYLTSLTIDIYLNIYLSL